MILKRTIYFYCNGFAVASLNTIAYQVIEIIPDPDVVEGRLEIRKSNDLPTVFSKQ